MDKKIIGNWGERVAKKYLENKGYTILETNWRNGHKEMDIIAYQKVIIGVEVKTRTSLGPPFTILGVNQLARLRLVLKKYCRQHHLNYQFSRIDLITIEIKDKDTIRLRHHLDI